MSDESVAIRVKEVWRLYKWDGDFCPDDPTKIDAQNHPLCAEIWEIQDGEAPQLIHKRT